MTKGLPVETALISSVVLLRQEQIDTIWPSVHLRLNPRQIDLELLRRVGHSTENAEAPALVTAATTSRQWLNARIGYSIPSRSATSVLRLGLSA